VKAIDQRAHRTTAVVILRGQTDRPHDLLPLAPDTISAIVSIAQGHVVRIDE